jgi:hypothetical protein
VRTWGRLLLIVAGVTVVLLLVALLVVSVGAGLVNLLLGL